MARIEVAVVGGGVVGLACAAALAEAGRSVCVIEREPRPGQGTSTHNSGVIHAGIYYPPGSLKAAPVRRAAATCSTPSANATACRIDRCGKLVVAADDDRDRRARPPSPARAHANGVADVVLLPPDAVRQHEPQVHAVAALWSPATGIVEPEALVRALARAVPRPRRRAAAGQPAGATPPITLTGSSSSRRTSAWSPAW